MKERPYPQTRRAAVKLAIATISRGIAPDRAFDSCFEGGQSRNRYVAAHVYDAALTDDALMRGLPRYLDVERARESYEAVFPMLVPSGV